MTELHVVSHVAWLLSPDNHGNLWQPSFSDDIRAVKWNSSSFWTSISGSADCNLGKALASWIIWGVKEILDVT